VTGIETRGTQRGWRKFRRNKVAPLRAKDRALAGFPGRERNTTMRMDWIARPGTELPAPKPPTSDPYDLGDEHGGWHPVAP